MTNSFLIETDRIRYRVSQSYQFLTENLRSFLGTAFRIQLLSDSMMVFESRVYDEATLKIGRPVVTDLRYSLCDSILIYMAFPVGGVGW